MRNKNFSILSLCCIIFIIASCNIFDWTTNDNDEVFYEGLELFNQKKFEEAKEKFAEAVESDPTRSDYLYYHAKATVFASDLNLYQIARQLIKIDTASVTNLKLPLYTREPPPMTESEDNEFKNNIYQVVWTSHDDITPIYFNKTHGEIQPDDIYFEFSLMSIARAILQLRDTNNDKRIDDNDIYFTISKAYNPKTGEYFYLPNIFEIMGWLKSSDENLQGFNEMLVNSAIYSTQGIVSLNYAFGDTTLFNNDDLENLNQNMETMSNIYQIGDGIDNDGDERIDEETLNGIDDDNDGRVDEDSHL
jgi:tetratricopeptide (TPR) repeat protein